MFNVFNFREHQGEKFNFCGYFAKRLPIFRNTGLFLKNKVHAICCTGMHKTFLRKKNCGGMLTELALVQIRPIESFFLVLLSIQCLFIAWFYISEKSTVTDELKILGFCDRWACNILNIVTRCYSFKRF